MTDVIALRRKWTLGAPLDRGGFGQVYSATSDSGEIAALKLIPKEPGASRELLFEDIGGARNVVPIIDRGEWRDYWVIVMPKAETSLKAYLEANPGPRPQEEAVAILSDINTALQDLAGKVVNRDIKPGNVLRLGGNWCVADFGIARYAETATSLDTRKYALTPAYAAPERWRSERATGATDVYSFGVLAYEILAGRLPFPGPTSDDLREQHLTQAPPSPVGVAPELVSLISDCLLKVPEARPQPANIAARLARALRAATPGAARLREANAHLAARAAEASAAVSAATTAAQRRRDLALGAIATFERISAGLRAAVADAAPAAVLIGRSGDTQWEARLGAARLILRPVVGTDPAAWGPRAAPFDVVAHAAIVLDIPRDPYGYEGRAHSLWYCDAQRPGEYRWYETAFMHAALMSRASSVEPFSLDPGPAAVEAVGSGAGAYDVAWPFTPIDQGNETAFIDRWLSWVADAASGRLQHPRTIPELPVEGSWRKS